MAKVGEGDARWIVSDRSDGKNVNSWHWEEKDLSKATHDAMKSLFTDLSLHSADNFSLKIKEVADVTGDVTVAQRKGKIMCYFELKMSLKWTGKVDGESVEGKLAMAEIEHDNFQEDFDITVSCTENNAAARKAEDWLRQGGRAKVRSTVRKYFDELFVQHNVGSMLKAGGSPAGTASPKQPTSAPAQAAKPAAPASASASSSSAGNSFNWKMRWRAPIDELFGILMNEQRASIYTRGPAKINPQNGGTFEFLGGVITGYYVKVEAPTNVTMQWRLSSWPAGVFSSVVMVLVKEEPGLTTLEFAHAGIPDGELDRVQQGWRVNFFDAIKMVFGLGMEYV